MLPREMIQLPYYTGSLVPVYRCVPRFVAYNTGTTSLIINMARYLVSGSKDSHPFRSPQHQPAFASFIDTYTSHNSFYLVSVRITPLASSFRRIT